LSRDPQGRSGVAGWNATIPSKVLLVQAEPSDLSPTPKVTQRRLSIHPVWAHPRTVRCRVKCDGAALMDRQKRARSQRSRNSSLAFPDFFQFAARLAHRPCRGLRFCVQTNERQRVVDGRGPAAERSSYSTWTPFMCRHGGPARTSATGTRLARRKQYAFSPRLKGCCEFAI
jgi:hypothetical protein